MDANCDNRFTTFDLFVLQQLVIGNIEEFPNCPSWIFVNAHQEFPEAFNETNVFPYESSYDMMMTEAEGTADLGLQVDQEALEILEFLPASGADLDNAIAGINRNEVKISWYHAAGNGLTVTKDEALFTLKVRAKKDITNVGELLTVIKNFDSNFELYQNQPNPFNATTNIAFELPTSSTVELTVADQYGRIIQTVQQDFEQGANQIKLDRNGMGAGIYYYTLKSGDFTATKRMLIIE